MSRKGANEVVGPGGGESDGGGRGGLDLSNSVGSATCIKVCFVHLAYCVSSGRKIKHCNFNDLFVRKNMSLCEILNFYYNCLMKCDLCCSN